MTEAECKMMNTIQMYGLFLTLNDGAKNVVLDRIEELMEDTTDGR